MKNIMIYILVELAMIMDRLYGGVCYSGIDVDPELKYPKGMLDIFMSIIIVLSIYCNVSKFIFYIYRPGVHPEIFFERR